MTQLELDLHDLLTAAQDAHFTPGPVDRVFDDTGHGIAVIRSDGQFGPVFVDLGSVLQVSIRAGGDLTPVLARALGVALIGWADRKDGAS